MKRLLQILLCIVLAFIGSGLYLQTIKNEKSEFYIGIGVLILAFILIPLFVYNGYKGKDLTRYSFKNMQGPEEKEKE
jgi:predicted tellurium resistance membrane protein TerC